MRQRTRTAVNKTNTTASLEGFRKHPASINQNFKYIFSYRISASTFVNTVALKNYALHLGAVLSGQSSDF